MELKYHHHITIILPSLYNHRYGPLVHHWTMRYEAKHVYFKGFAQSMGNFINLPYSLAMRHQHLQCYLGASTHELPGTDLEVGLGIYVCVICVDIIPVEMYVQSVYKYMQQSLGWFDSTLDRHRFHSCC